MKIRIIDNEGCVTATQVMNYEYEKGSKKLTIWDYADNSAVITFSTEKEAAAFERTLYDFDKAMANADIDWQEKNIILRNAR